MATRFCRGVTARLRNMRGPGPAARHAEACRREYPISRRYGAGLRAHRIRAEYVASLDICASIDTVVSFATCTYALKALCSLCPLIVSIHAIV